MAKLEDIITSLRNKRLQQSSSAVPDELQGINKDKIKQVLTKLSLGDKLDIIDCVFALLDDETDSLFQKVKDDFVISDGATTAHIACHIGILQRGNTKLDREGRDYYIKPLRDIGAIEPVYLNKEEFIDGHPKPKSPNSAYRLSESFKAILKAPDKEWEELLKEWASEEKCRERKQFQAELEEASKKIVDSSHSKLIRASVDYYATKFLDGFEVIYIDDGDGDRISSQEKDRLKKAGIEITLDDAMPDVLLWNPKTDELWVIEAVTSDGEVDEHKVKQIHKLCSRCKKSGVGFTTTYLTWKDAASRQSANTNIAVDTFIWILADPAKHLLVKSF